MTSAVPFATTGVPVTRDNYLTAYKKVISAAGPLRLDASSPRPLRDELSTILVNKVVQQRRHHVSSPAGTGAFIPNVPAGYTRLEEYLHFLAVPHATMPKSTTAVPTAIDVDLRKFTSGFVSAPVFTLA